MAWDQRREKFFPDWNAAALARAEYGRSTTTVETGSRFRQSNQIGGGLLVPDFVAPGWTSGTSTPHVLGAMYRTDVLVARPLVEQTATISHLLYPQQGGRARSCCPPPVAQPGRRWGSTLAAAGRGDPYVEPRELEAGIRLAAVSQAGVFAPQAAPRLTRSRTVRGS